MVSPALGRVVIFPATSAFLVRPPSPTTRRLQMVLQVWAAPTQQLAEAGRAAQSRALELREAARQAAWLDLEDSADGGVGAAAAEAASEQRSGSQGAATEPYWGMYGQGEAHSRGSEARPPTAAAVYSVERARARLTRNITVADGSGRSVLVFDGLLTPLDAAMALRAVLAGPRGGVTFEDSEGTGNDNVVWIAAHDADDFTRTRLWAAVQSVLMLASGGRTGWFPYDVSCNHLELVDEPRRHLDCQAWEDELTVVVYLNHEWRRDATRERWPGPHAPSSKGPWPFHGGETVFYAGPTLASDAVAAVRPAFGRVVVFPGTLWHAGRPPTPAHGGRRFSFVVKASNSERYARRKMLRESMDIASTTVLPMLSRLREDGAGSAWNDRVTGAVAKAAQALRGLVEEVADSVDDFGLQTEEEEVEGEEEEGPGEEEEDEEEEEEDGHGGEEYGKGEESGEGRDGGGGSTTGSDGLGQTAEDREAAALWGMSDAERRAQRDDYERREYGMFNGYGRRPGEHTEWMGRVLGVASSALSGLLDEDSEA